jgi:hypothetical protein
MAKRVTYHVIAYGEWTRPRMRNFREQCCDCGLIHRLDFRIVDTRKRVHARLGAKRKDVQIDLRGLKIEFRTRRDDGATATARRRLKFRPSE